MLVVTTTSNQVYAFDVEAKQLGDWSMRHTQALPKRFQEFPGEVIGLSFPPSASSLPVIVYSSRYCLLPFYMLQSKLLKWLFPLKNGIWFVEFDRLCAVVWLVAMLLCFKFWFLYILTVLSCNRFWFLGMCY